MNEKKQTPVYTQQQVPQHMTAAEEDKFWQEHYMAEPLLNELFSLQQGPLHFEEDEL